MRSAKYRAWVRSLDCVVCSVSQGIEAAHTGPRGLGQKSSDYSCIPLCRRHHRTGNDSIHSMGPRRFAERHQLDIASIVARLNGQGLLVDSPHRTGRRESSPEFTRFHCPCGWRTAWYRSESDARAALHFHLEKKQALDAPEAPGSQDQPATKEARP